MPSSIEVIVGLALAIVPGYVAVTVWARARTWRGPVGDYRTTLESLAFSLIIQVTLAPLTIPLIWPVRSRIAEFPERTAVWLLVVTMVVPAGGGAAIGWVQDRLDAQRLAGQELGWVRRTAATLQPPSIWDWLFTGNPPFGKFLVITFDDGTEIGGVFAEDTMTMTSPQAHGIFLSPEWRMEGSDLVEALPGSNGIMVTTWSASDGSGSWRQRTMAAPSRRPTGGKSIATRRSGGGTFTHRHGTKGMVAGQGAKPTSAPPRSSSGAPKKA